MCFDPIVYFQKIDRLCNFHRADRYSSLIDLYNNEIDKVSQLLHGII